MRKPSCNPTMETPEREKLLGSWQFLSALAIPMTGSYPRENRSNETLPWIHTQRRPPNQSMINVEWSTLPHISLTLEWNGTEQTLTRKQKQNYSKY